MSNLRPRWIRPACLLSWLAVLACAGILAAACAQDVTVIGVLEPNQDADVLAMRDGFLEALRDGGYKAGENIRVIRRDAAFREQTLGESLQGLIDKEQSELLFVMRQSGVKAAVDSKTTLPVFFAGCVRCEKAWTTRPANVTGATIALGDSDYRANGRRAGELALRFLKGEPLASLVPVP